MAQTRLYRNFLLDDDEFGVPQHRTPSRQRAADYIVAPRSVLLGSRPDHEVTTNSHGYGFGTALTTDEDGDEDEDADGDEDTDDDEEDEHSHGRGHGTATHGDERPEPVLHDAQMDLSPRPSPLHALPEYGWPKHAMPSSSVSASRVSHDAQSSGSSSTSRMPEFFDNVVFQLVLRNPITAHQLQKFAQSQLCGENLDFLGRVDQYLASLNKVSRSIYEIHQTFLAPTARAEINLPERVRTKVIAEMKTALNVALPTLESVFAEAQHDIEHLVFSDIYPRFVCHQMSVSAARALGANRTEYGGLGDCFVLTDPAKPDNPIVYVSDGFAKVTGYSRSEIILRNCRFLQSRHTDRSALRRLKTAIENRKESVELLLNYKKGGEPFWNLLYTTPLYDASGNLAFFLGGQINCSTTIHTSSDVLRILAQQKNDEETRAGEKSSPSTARPARSRNLLKAWRSGSRSNLRQRAPGIEGNVLGRIEDMSLKDQMTAFYTAYSNVRAHHALPSRLMNCPTLC